jgi:hypothetical protein
MMPQKSSISDKKIGQIPHHEEYPGVFFGKVLYEMRTLRNSPKKDNTVPYNRRQYCYNATFELYDYLKNSNLPADRIKSITESYIIELASQGVMYGVDGQKIELLSKNNINKYIGLFQDDNLLTTFRNLSRNIVNNWIYGPGNQIQLKEEGKHDLTTPSAQVENNKTVGVGESKDNARA